MNNKAFNTVIFALLSFSLASNTYAGATQANVKSFTEMLAYVQKINDPGSTLVVMDNDATLTMMSCPDPSEPATCQYLGGAAWFDWQDEQIQKRAEPRVADSFPELLEISGLLFSINEMAFTSKDIPEVLDTLTRMGVRLLVETARGNDTVSATENQFMSLTVNNTKYPTLFELISNHSLVFGKNKLASKASPYLPCHDKKTITYRNGAMYLSGQDKGWMLNCMLDEYNRLPTSQSVKNVVFIDDTLKNVVSVFRAFRKSKKYQVYALHYTALAHHKEALTKGKMAATYQKNATRRWQQINSVLKSNLQTPALPK